MLFFEKARDRLTVVGGRQAHVGHVGARHVGLGLGDQLRDVLGLPADVFVAHGLGVAEARQRAGLAPVHAEQIRPHHPGSTLGHRVADAALSGKHFGTTLGIRGALSGRHRLNQGEGQQADEGQTQRSEHKKTPLKIHALASRRTPTPKNAEARVLRQLGGDCRRSPARRFCPACQLCWRLCQIAH